MKFNCFINQKVFEIVKQKKNIIKNKLTFRQINVRQGLITSNKYLTGNFRHLFFVYYI